MREWSLRLESSGGITGRGDGSAAIDSGGTVTRTTPNGIVCRGKVEGERLAPLARAIAAARTGAWRSQYFLEGGADFFTYTLTMDIDGHTRPMVEWTDGVELPADLQALWNAIDAVKRSVDCPDDQRPAATS